MIAFHASSGFAQVRSGVHNPWLELSDETREGLRPFMGPADVSQPLSSDTNFESWYHTYYHGNAADQALKYPEYKYTHMTVPERVSSACVFLQIKKDFLDKLETPLQLKASVTYADAQGAVIAKISDAKALQTALKKAHFGPDFCAGPKDPKPYIYCGEGGPPKVWGLRGQVHGQTLHWYQTAQMVLDKEISVHIDYFNPGQEAKFSSLPPSKRVIDENIHVPDQNIDRAFTHVFKDLVKWDDRNMVTEMNAQANYCGIGATDVAMAQSETEDAPPESKWTKLLIQLNRWKSFCP
jgi:hypothetical protein